MDLEHVKYFNSAAGVKRTESSVATVACWGRRCCPAPSEERKEEEEEEAVGERKQMQHLPL